MNKRDKNTKIRYRGLNFRLGFMQGIKEGMSKSNVAWVKKNRDRWMKEAKIEILNELLDRFTEGNFVGISSVHRLVKEVKEEREKTG